MADDIFGTLHNACFTCNVGKPLHAFRAYFCTSGRVNNPRPEDVALFGAPGRGPKASRQVPGLLE